jgi:hypothetical protein
MVGVNNYINMFICPTTSNTSKNKGQRKDQLWFNFELQLIAIKLVKEESLVDLLHSYHAVPFVALYFWKYWMLYWTKV